MVFPSSSSSLVPIRSGGSYTVLHPFSLLSLTTQGEDDTDTPNLRSKLTTSLNGIEGEVDGVDFSLMHHGYDY